MSKRSTGGRRAAAAMVRAAEGLHVRSDGPDAARAVKVEYEILPHLVQEHDLAKAGNRAKPAGEQVTGDPDKAFQDAATVSEGEYGIPVITPSDFLIFNFIQDR